MTDKIKIYKEEIQHGDKVCSCVIIEHSDGADRFDIAKQAVDSGLIDYSSDSEKEQIYQLILQERRVEPKKQSNDKKDISLTERLKQKRQKRIKEKPQRNFDYKG